jgi:hypothetical protein
LVRGVGQPANDDQELARVWLLGAERFARGVNEQRDCFRRADGRGAFEPAEPLVRVRGVNQAQSQIDAEVFAKAR